MAIVASPFVQALERVLNAQASSGSDSVLLPAETTFERLA
jgi:hypothetical protein